MQHTSMELYFELRCADGSIPCNHFSLCIGAMNPFKLALILGFLAKIPLPPAEEALDVATWRDVCCQNVNSVVWGCL